MNTFKKRLHEPLDEVCVVNPIAIDILKNQNDTFMAGPCPYFP